MNLNDPTEFAKLTLQDALDLAALIEEDARERYAEFEEQMRAHRTPGAAAFFLTMVYNEAKHRDSLRKRRKALYGDAPSRVNAHMLCEIEAPDYHDASIFMSLRAALEVALKAEIRAHDFYASALPHVTDPKIRALFTDLRDEEKQHRVMVEQQLAALPAESKADPGETHGDPPVAL